jgi:hypothetical protein
VLRAITCLLLNRVHGADSCAWQRCRWRCPKVRTENLCNHASWPWPQGVLLDQFGVLHDGRMAYPGAVEAVERLHSQGMQLLIISNSSRSEHACPSLAS